MCYCRCWAHLERQETERIYDRAQELVDQTCQNKSLKALEWFLYLCSSSGAKVMPKIFSAAVLCKCFQTAKPAPSLSMTAEIRPNWVWLFCQSITTAFSEDPAWKNREQKYDLCCDQIEIIYGHGHSPSPFVFCPLADWFQESPYCCCFWPRQDLGADYRVVGGSVWETGKKGRCRGGGRLIDQALTRK